MPLAAAALDEVEQRVAVLAVHAIDGVLLAQQRGADFQGGEVHRHQDGPLPRLLGGLQVLQPLDMGQARQPGPGPPPAHGHFEEGDTGGGKVGLEQALPFVDRQLREAQLQVARGDAPPLTGKAVHHRSQRGTDFQQDPVRQLDHQPQQAQAQPQAPETWVKEIGTKTRAFH